MTYLIKGGRVIDPVEKRDGIFDILVEDGKIVRIESRLDDKAGQVIDAGNKIVAAGFIDMHTHLREPGREDKETVLTGTRSAVRGGFTGVACMPNTEPAIDSPAAIGMVKEIIKRDAISSVFIIGAVTMGRSGKTIADFEKMKREGIVAVSDDGACIQDERVMLEALKACRKSGLLLIDHCEDAGLAAGGVMNKGFVSTKMGLRGIPKEAEYKMVGRDIALAAKTGARIHIAHVSCAESVDLIRKAKRDGIRVTAETAPHYFTLSEDCCATYDTNTKMNPPLRTAGDIDGIKTGLADGTIDAIATDHAPHTDSEKYVEFDNAPFGIIGLETALSLAVMELVDKKAISWPELILKMSANPASILGVDKGSLKTGKPADIVIIDPGREYVYRKDSIESKSKNSPFIDWKLKAKVTDVFVAGKPVMRDGVIP